MYEVRLSLEKLLINETNQTDFKYGVPLSKVMNTWLTENCQHDYSSTYESMDVNMSDMFVVYDFENEDEAALFKLRFG